ncbi:MAG: hypothetical protein NT064_12065 [Proteobacteria bacterium]|nr:hypothetical protein [Pseudomonadota bacterium]
MAATSFVVAMHTDTRLQLIHDWLADDVALEPYKLAPASADASFRRYFRATTAQRSLIVMDAPPGWPIAMCMCPRCLPPTRRAACCC